MQQKLISATLIFVWIFTSVVPPVQVAHAASRWDDLSPDVDLDGLSNQVETAGWCNREGCFQTDPYSADTDGDGLLDGEEHAYDTDPTDIASPGIYVAYEESYKTRKYFHPTQNSDHSGYFHWKEAGTREIATEAFVVRRGTAFTIGGPPGSTLSISGPSGSSITYDTSENNLCVGGWHVNVTTNDPVGQYDATLTFPNGSSATIPIYVIFEFPTVTESDPTKITQLAKESGGYNHEISQADIDAFLYNEVDGRDEYSVWFMTRQQWYTAECGSEPCTDRTTALSSPYDVPHYYLSRGYAQGFATEHYQKFIFRDLVMPAMEGLFHTDDVMEKLSKVTDYNLRVDYNVLHRNASTSLYRDENNYQDGGACQDQASVLVGLSRSAGILAKPVLVDYYSMNYQASNAGVSRNDQLQWWGEGPKDAWYDHSVVAWTGDQNGSEWTISRSYETQELFDTEWPWSHGSRANKSSLPGNYIDRGGDLLVTMKSDWDYDAVNTVWTGSWPSMEFYAANPNYGTHYDYSWDSRHPLWMIEQNPQVEIINRAEWYNDSFEPTGWKRSGSSNEHRLPDVNGDGDDNDLYSEEQNWPITPDPIRCPPYMRPFFNGGVNDCPFTDNRNNFDATVGDGVGSLSVEDNFQLLAPEDDLFQTLEQPTEGSRPVHMLGETARGATLVGDYVQYALDTNSDGFDDALAVELDLQISTPGEYTVAGSLYDVSGAWINEARWTGTDPFARLVFTDTLGFAGPFILRDVYLYNDTLTLIDEIATQIIPAAAVGPVQFEPAADLPFDTTTPEPMVPEPMVPEPVNQPNNQPHQTFLPLVVSANTDTGLSTVAQTAPVSTGPVRPTQRASSRSVAALSGPPVTAFGLNITPTLTFAASTPDADGDGKFDSLTINVGLEVTQENTYRLEGWLMDCLGDATNCEGNLVAFAQTDSTSLAVGDQSIDLVFDGRVLNDHGGTGPYKLVELKVLSGGSSYDSNTHTILDEVVAVSESQLALNYTASQFENATQDGAQVFSDNMESGSSQWGLQSLWSLVNDSEASTNRWSSVANNQTGTLQSTDIDLTDYASPIVRFRTCHQLGSTETASLSLLAGSSTSQGTAVTYSDEVRASTMNGYDLDSFGLDGLPNLRLQYNADSSGSSYQWQVDDVAVYGWPAIKNVFITPSSLAVTVGDTVVFTPSYQSVNTSLPITYTWNFGDGSPDVVTTSTTVAHTYTTLPVSPTVVLTVANPYHEAGNSRSMSEGTPPQTAGIIVTSLNTPPLFGQPITVTAQLTPTTTTTPVTYEWNMGDGVITETTTPQFVYTYTSGGDYTIQLKASNDFGEVQATTSVSLKEAIESTRFSYSPQTPIDLDPLTLAAVYSPTTASPPITYTWNITGTPFTSTASTINVVLGQGTYNVQVTTTNGLSGPISYQELVTITGRPIISASFTKESDPNPVNDTTAVFTASYGSAQATVPITYVWNFDDGSGRISTSANSLTHTFLTTGTKVVSLTVTNGFGSATITQTATIPYDDDEDGLSNSYEIAIGTLYDNDDSDNDGLLDGDEVLGFTYTGYIDHVDYGRVITTNPLMVDTDSDGVRDGDEGNRHPNDSDTDDDGLSDLRESGATGETSPISPDTDGDGLSDYLEVDLLPTNPLNPNSEVDDAGTEIYDDIPDLVEVTGGITPNLNLIDLNNDGVYDVISNTIDPANAVPFDTNGDGRIDALETDSDGDGIGDTVEYVFNTDYMCSDTVADLDNDGIPSCRDNDADGDGLPNYRDLNSDNDDYPDAVEGEQDSNNDGVLDYLQVGPTTVALPVTEVSLTATTTTPYANQTFSFVAIISPSNALLPISYIWDFGDGSAITTTSRMTVEHSYASLGSYTANVTATNSLSSATTSLPITVVSRGLDGVALVLDPTYPPINQAVQLTAQISPSLATPPITYTWNFGDGTVSTTSTGQTSYIYTSYDSFTVTVTADSPYGSAVSASQMVTVGNAITDVTLSYSPPQPEVVQTVFFTATADLSNSDANVTYRWQVNGVTVSTTTSPTYSHVFNQADNYPVVVELSNVYGTISTSTVVNIGQPIEQVGLVLNPGAPVQYDAVTFTATPSPANVSQPIRYVWSFSHLSDPIVTTSPTISQSYEALDTFTVSVVASNAYNSQTASTEFTVAPRPLSAVEVSYAPNDDIQIGDVVTLSAAIQPSNLTQPVTYTWKLGDGTTRVSTSNTITHSYSESGGFTVNVMADNPANAPVSDQTVVPVGGRAIQRVTIQTSPNFLLENELITFIARVEPTNVSLPITYTWDFGDGSAPVQTTSSTVTHSFSAVQQYTVVLTSENGFGAPFVRRTIVQVDGSPVSEAAFSTALADPNFELRVTFSTSYSPTTATQPINYEWDFGDGVTVTTTLTRVIHEYAGNGSYPVRMIARNSYGGALAARTITMPLDSDGDGVSDVTEVRLGTDPQDTNSDDDNLLDGQEVAIGTDPAQADSDGDNISDDIEVGPDPSNPRDSDGDQDIDALDTDSDNDTLSDLAEGTVHSDNDGLPDYRDPDSDGDTLTDFDEANVYNTLSTNLDTDNDGATDGQEVSISTDPNLADSDSDGIPDGVEIGDPSAPNNSDGTGPIDALDTDSDNDTILDADEYDADQDASTTGDLCTSLLIDTDRDGIPNCQDNDVDGDGTPNYRDLDSDNDSLSDQTEGTADRNNNNIADFVDDDRFNAYLPIMVR